MSENPLIDTVVGINAVSLANVDARLEGVLLVRLAALVAVDAPPASYLATLRAADGTMLELEDARNVLIAVAPIVGVPRVISAARNLADALGFAIAVDEPSWKRRSTKRPEPAVHQSGGARGTALVPAELWAVPAGAPSSR